MHDAQRDWVADIFRWWDCYEQNWVQNAPLLVRFEGFDALIASDGVLVLKAGISEDQQTHTLGPEQCLCWRKDAALNVLIGKYMTPDDVHQALFG